MPALDALPSKIGPYRLLDKIGEGGMGVVWEAKDTRLDRVVALNLGRNLAEGSPQETANNPAVVEAYLGDPRLMTMSTPEPS